MPTLTEQKKAIRQAIKAQKTAFTAEAQLAQSEQIAEQLQQHPLWRSSPVICLYWALPDEVQTQALIQRMFPQKTILLPVVRGSELELRPYEGEDRMKVSADYGIAEPIGNAWHDLLQIPLIVVPGMAFDPSGHRLGRGKGFYDRLLPQMKAYKIGTCFDFQYVEAIPFEPHDITMDEIIHA